jgi:long-subunit fatty acid transport protein
MFRFAAASAALLASTAIAQAGGIERAGQSPAFLFEEGTYVELSYSWANPSVSGVQTLDAAVAGAPIGSQSGDMAPAYSFWGLSFRSDLSDNLSFALIFDEPIGADVNYAGVGAPPGYLYTLGTGSQAEINSRQITAALRYEFDNGFSVYGGLRGVQADGNVSLFNGYTMTATGSDELGYMVGAAFERPDIALRVALTYYSATTHSFAATEAGVFNTSFQTTIPQQVLLEAQSGVAPGTLVFGSVRWTDWSEFDITPDVFSDGVPDGNYGANSLVSYDNDSWTWTLGGARVLNDNWTLLGSLTYEAQQGGFSGNLGPTDGRTSVGLAARYTQGPLRVTAGVSYSWIGPAETEAPTALGAPPGTEFAQFRDNHALGFGLRIGYSF